MSGRVGGQQRSDTKNARASARALRRASVRASVAQQVAARRRRRKVNMVLGILATILVIAGGVAGGIYYAKHHDSTSSAAGGAEALKTKPVVTAGEGTLTELTVKTLVEGGGAPVTAGQTLSVNYVGVSYKTGEEFDSSWSRSQPFDVVIGQGQVIEGWDKGLIGVKVGSRVQLDIPAAMAYGDEASTSGAPTGPLRFVVDVISAA